MLNFKHLNRVPSGHIPDTLLKFSVNGTYLAMENWTLKTTLQNDSLIVALSVVLVSMLYNVT